MSDLKPKDKIAGLPRDLIPRLVSGIVLAAGAVLATWAGASSFALLVTAIALVVAWEWGRIVRGGGVDAIFLVHAIAVVAACGLTVAGLAALAVVALVIGAITVAALGFQEAGRMSALGVIYSGLPAIVLIWIRLSQPHGFAAALLVMSIVVAADTGAYFTGRALGGPKLMPAISPNKTWSGFLGGLAAAVLVAMVFARLGPGTSALRLALLAGFFAVVAQAGDLMESALKRQHGVKDASGLIPGHGGFMDRVDGLIFVALAAGLIALLIDIQNPGAALLLGR